MDGSTKSSKPLVQPVVLILHESEAEFAALSSLLEKERCTCVWAISSDECYKLARQLRPALILVDLLRRETATAKLVENLRAESPIKDIPFLLLAPAEISPTEVTKILKLGSVDFVSQPLDRDLFVAKARLFLELSELRRKQKGAPDSNRELQVSHEKYQTFVQQSSDGMWRFEVKTPISVKSPVEEQVQLILKNCFLAECNDAMARMYGFERGDQLVGAKLNTLLIPDDPQNIAYLMAFVSSGYRLSDVESVELDRHGNEKHFSNSLVGFIEEGQIVRAWGIQKDVTEQALSRKKLELTLNAADLGIFQWNLVSNEATWSEETYAVLGFDGKRPRPTYESFLGAIHPSDRSEVDLQLKKAIENLSGLKLLFRVLNHEGKVRWVQVHARVFSGANGKPTYMLGTVQDLTDRKRIEEEALESEERFRLIVDSIPQGVWRTNPDGAADYFSERFRELVPCDTTDFLGWGWTNCIHPDDKPILVTEWERCRALAIPISIEFRLKGDDGVYHWFRSDGRPLLDQKGAIVKYYGTWTNIEDQKKASIELLEAKTAAEKANELKSAFLTNMSHEIRTPLGAMIGFADLLRDATLKETERQNYLAILHRNGIQLGHLINDILDLSKVETGHLNFEFMQFDVQTLVTDCISLFQVRAREQGVELIFESGPNVPSSIVSDPLRLRQILTNIIGNSVKFTEKGSIRLKIVGDASPSGRSRVCFTIQDSGIGIASEGIPNLFKVFTQADNSITRRYGGTGLGLALSRRLARALGGDLELVETAPGKGSTFRLSVENREATSTTVVLENRPLQHKGDEIQKNRLMGLHILIVEDAKDNQQLIERYVTRQGATVEIVENGLEGVRAARARKFDLVLMDIQMPIMDGYTATSELRKGGYSVPILALTAHAMSDIRERCLSAGYSDYLPKPLNSKELIQKIVDLISKKS